jgi:hypothetical protein
MALVPRRERTGEGGADKRGVRGERGLRGAKPLAPRVPGEIGESSVSEGRRWESFRGDGGRGGIVTGRDSAFSVCERIEQGEWQDKFEIKGA